MISGRHVLWGGLAAVLVAAGSGCQAPPRTQAAALPLPQGYVFSSLSVPSEGGILLVGEPATSSGKGAVLYRQQGQTFRASVALPFRNLLMHGGMSGRFLYGQGQTLRGRSQMRFCVDTVTGRWRCLPPDWYWCGSPCVAPQNAVSPDGQSAVVAVAPVTKSGAARRGLWLARLQGTRPELLRALPLGGALDSRSQPIFAGRQKLFWIFDRTVWTVRGFSGEAERREAWTRVAGVPSGALLALSPDRHTLLAIGCDGRYWLLNRNGSVADGSAALRSAADGTVVGAVWSPDSKHVAIVTSEGKVVPILDAHGAAAMVWRMQNGQTVNSVAWSPQSRGVWALVASPRGQQTLVPYSVP